MDDDVHYQGHSQVQHSQAYSPMETVSTMQSLSRLTPLNPSQILHQAHGSISVDDDDLPQRDEKDSRKNGGGDSPFMHLSDKSDNLSVPRSKHSLEDPSVMNESSQYSYLGLGVHHGSDVVITNTASLLEDPVGGGVGMIGIDKALLASHDSDMGSHRTASPLLEVSKSNEELDDTPVLLKHEPIKTKISASSSQVPSSTRDFARLTSIDHGARNAKSLRNSTPLEESPTKDPEGESRHLNLSAITSLKRSSNSASKFANDSDLQETPERQRSSTIASGNPTAFRRASNSAKTTRLGKLTSLEYIRASLRMKLKKMSNSKETDNGKKPLKSALRKTASISSQHSTSSIESSGSHHLSYSNRHALDYSIETSPAASSLSSPQHYPVHMEYPPGAPDDFMFQDGYGGPGYVPHRAGPMGYPQEPYTNPIPLSPSGYGPELSPILSVSQFDYPHPMMYPPQEVGILPNYSGYNQMSYHDPYFSQPPIYDDEDEDDNLPALHTSLRNMEGASQSQRNVTWNLQPEEIPSTPVELTPSSSSDNEQT